MPSVKALKERSSGSTPAYKQGGNMNIDVLKEHLTEETFNQVSTELEGKDLKLADLSQGGYVSKSKYDAAITDANSHKETAEKWEGNYNTLKGEFDTFKTTTEGEKAANAKQLIKAMAQTDLVKAKARDIEVVMPLIDLEKLTLTDTGLEGLKDQLDALKEAKAYLFETEEAAAQNKGKSGLNHGAGGDMGDEAKIRKIMGLPQK